MPNAPDARPTPAAAAAGAPSLLRSGLSLLLPLGLVLACLLLVAAGATALLRWMLLDDAGSAWLLQRVPGVQVQGFKGALLGQRWQADRLELRWDGGRQSLTLHGLDARGLRWQWRPDEHGWAALDVQQLSVQRLALRTVPAAAAARPMPASVALPLRVRVAQAELGWLAVDDQAPWTQLALQGLLLESHPDGRHRVQQAQAQWQGLQIDASGDIATRAPVPLALSATLRPLAASAAGAGHDAPRWAAVLRADGTLADLQLSGTLRGVPLAGREPPAVDLRAGLRPLLAWPLSTLDLQTRELDLAALSLHAPQTRIAGQAVLTARARDAPVSASVTLDNALPGRWNEGRLPLRRLTGRLGGELAQPGRLALRELLVTLADGSRAAGSVSGSATWDGPLLQAELQLSQLVPQRLDGRAAAMQLSGPVALQWRGWPSPDGRSAAAAPSLGWTVDLQGAFDAAPQPVRLEMEGSASEDQLQLTRLRASAGNAVAELRAQLQRVPASASSGATAAARPWRLDSTGSLVDFDPLPWWPGSAGGAWRQGPHRLSAGWQLDLQLPGSARALPALALAQRLAGSGSLRVHDSVLAGVPLSADLRLSSSSPAVGPAGPGPRPAAPVQLRGELQLGGNQLTLDGRADPAGNGSADRLNVELKADTLATLAPLARLHPALADWVPRQGSASATLQAEGRWPQLQTEGRAQVAQLQVGRAAVARGALQWQLEAGSDGALNLTLDMSGLRLGEQQAEQLRARLSGTRAEHRIELTAALPLRPPALAAQLMGVPAQAGTQAALLAQGAWAPDPAGGGRWRARIERLDVAGWDGTPADVKSTDGTPADVKSTDGKPADTKSADGKPAEAAAADTPRAMPWAQARDLRAELQVDGSGRLLSLRAEPGRVQLADSAALRWDEVQLDLRGEQAQIDLRADVEPFALAPLLARLQPAMGWAGDMRLAARVDIRAAERFSADLVFERRDGDLHIAGNEGVQLLGLSELRVALSARDGLWTLTPQFKGRSLGEVTGSARVQTTPQRRWPPADAPLSGDLQARVADLGIWGAWVPPGWRLAGELRTRALLGGSFGEPRTTGEVTGRALSVRNLLQGVNVSDGDVAIQLEGDTARIERFTLKGGDGTLVLTGNATLGRAPQARLQARAERFRAVGRVDRLVVVSGQADVALGGEQTRVEGRIRVDEALFDASRADAPSLDDDVTVHRAGAPAADEARSRPAAPRRAVALALEIDLGQNTQVRGRGVDSKLAGSLRLSNPGGRVDLRGTISAIDGTYAAYGQKLELERGIVAFGGPYDNPRLDILALRPNIDQRVGVAITGTVQTPRVRLFAEPELSDTEKLSWLVLGRAADGLGRGDTALLQRAAVALLAGEGEAPTDALMRNLGIDELSLKQADGEVRDTVISLGKQLSRRWYLGYERGVNATTGTWQLIYRIAQRFTLRAQSGLENSLDLIWTWRLQETPPEAAMQKSTVVPP